MTQPSAGSSAMVSLMSAPIKLSSVAWDPETMAFRSSARGCAACLPLTVINCRTRLAALSPAVDNSQWGCHGPTVQNNGLRVDRRSSVMKPGSRRVMPGSLENSFLYHRLVGTDFGLQMPPTGALHAEQIQIIKAWIEQGAP